MMIPDHLHERVKAMIAEVGYTTSAWFCRVGRRSLIRWMHGGAEPMNGNVALLEYGVSRFERSRQQVAVSPGTEGASHSRN